MNNSLAELKHVDEVSPMSEADQPLMKEIYEVLQRHGAADRFGLTLLHQHFSLAEGEVMLEKTDEEKRVQTLEVVVLSELPKENVLQTAWRLGAAGPTVMLTCSQCCMLNTNNVHKSYHIESN